MAKSLKYIFLIALLAAVVFIAYEFNNIFSPPQLQVEQNSELILDRLEKVNKLITLDAYFSEVYDYKDYYYYDLSIFRKKALIRIKAKVSVGYNFEKLNIVADEDSKTITIFEFPEPEILSIDHDLDYYDISQGTFNSFTEEDYNKINKNAKDFIREKAQDNDIFSEAEAQKDELIDMFNLMTRAAGWRLQVGENESVKILD